ncbi:MAG: hypothetical protein EXR72_27175 [Myxococcales bacterium]|nr:hypothetical protein [Myxococcales bacterium]
MNPRFRSTWIYLGLIGFVGLLGAILAAIPRDRFGAAIEPPSWAEIVPICLLGWLGLLASTGAGFPAIWDPAIPFRRRIGRPALVGAVLGAFLVAADWLWPLGIPNAHFPEAIPFYACAGILLELLYRLLILTLPLWLAARLLGPKGRARAFWVAAILLSCLEPASQVAGLREVATVPLGTPVLAAIFGFIFLVNLGAAVAYRRAGFLAPVALRLGFYLVWHLLRTLRSA